MRTLSTQALWKRLQNSRLVDGDAPAVEKTASLWFVRVMLGAAGWIGSLFLFGFVGIGFSFVMRSAIASLTVGAFFCGGAFALLKSYRDSDFVTQFGLAIGLAGQMLLIYGIFKMFQRDDSLFYGTVFVIETVLTILMPNFIYRLITSLAATIALSLALNSVGVYEIATGMTAAGFALVWMNDTRWGRFSAIFEPVGYGLALSLLFYTSSFLWGRGLWLHRSFNGANWNSIYAPWLSQALVLVVVLAVVFFLLKRMHIEAASRSGITTLGAAILVMVASFPVPGIAHALLILVIGFAVCNRMLIGFGLLAFGGFLSNYYYMMQSTLLVKSMLLLLLGAILIVGRLVLRKWIPSAEMGGHADA